MFDFGQCHVIATSFFAVCCCQLLLLMVCLFFFHYLHYVLSSCWGGEGDHGLVDCEARVPGRHASMEAESVLAIRADIF